MSELPSSNKSKVEDMSSDLEVGLTGSSAETESLEPDSEACEIFLPAPNIIKVSTPNAGIDEMR